MKTIICLYCGERVEAKRPNRKKFCSNRCAQRFAKNLPSKRECKICGREFKIVKGGQNRKYCSEKCSKKAYTKQTLAWHERNPNSMKKYNKKRKAKNPGVWREKYRRERAEAIKMLGGKCIVCGASNPNWLHIDYKPTTIDKPYRHPRHLKYIKEHIIEFRILCANHHYELTLTGKIEGTSITQRLKGGNANAKE
jgi:endogenous inhibitor of DNA gyrase (YacG/DUF329 family)